MYYWQATHESYGKLVRETVRLSLDQYMKPFEDDGVSRYNILGR